MARRVDGYSFQGETGFFYDSFLPAHAASTHCSTAAAAARCRPLSRLVGVPRAVYYHRDRVLSDREGPQQLV